MVKTGEASGFVEGESRCEIPAAIDGMGVEMTPPGYGSGRDRQQGIGRPSLTRIAQRARSLSRRQHGKGGREAQGCCRGCHTHPTHPAETRESSGGVQESAIGSLKYSKSSSIPNKKTLPVMVDEVPCPSSQTTLHHQAMLVRLLMVPEARWKGKYSASGEPVLAGALLGFQWTYSADRESFFHSAARAAIGVLLSVLRCNLQHPTPP